ncbi:unnamed protein product [Polarella glacialis]|uniref:Glycosyl transferase family 25 domain-containing protein n=1 Tax=Polarella glacialis TaxID=89957 RepID=A0A813GHK6_POLGL|nr:unnamed protein product [Polarella glacialis]|mmetsp:Transcript_12121/g.19161  ORF Transcript_12121/g.19161 Transcript_12121/m.19161 type:complete len:345 (-) Transcript_12121:59-1093(-)
MAPSAQLISQVKPRGATGSRETAVASNKEELGQKRQAEESKNSKAARRRKSIATPQQNAAGIPCEARPAICDLRTIVINLERRADRMEGCQERLQLHCPELPFTRFLATDGRQTQIPLEEVTTSWNTARNVIYQKKRAIRMGWDDLDTYAVRELTLSPGERGCSSSHIRAWRHCLEQSGGTERPLLVLEDDAAPTAEFCELLDRAMGALPADAHLLYLGYSQASEWKRELSPELVQSEYVWTTVAYLVWPAGAKLLLDRLPVNEPVDNWMAALAAQDEIKAYCVRPEVVLQADAWNVNSDVAHSDEHYWGPNSDSDIRHSDAPEAMAASVAEGSCFWDIDSDSE